MRSASIFVAILFVQLITSSCKKSVENHNITGEWKLIEHYNGYTNGGNFRWNTILPEHSHILSFTEDGEYRKTTNSNVNQPACNGTYLLQSGNVLQINSDCNARSENLIVTTLTVKTLIIDQPVMEGVIRYKYSAIK